jgi:hypothetical protein
MDLRAHANLLLENLAAHLHQPDHALALDDNTECFLTFESGVVVMFYFEPEIGALIINLPIAKMPQTARREEVALELLFGNYSWNLTEGGTLGVDRTTGMIALSYLIPLPLEHAAQLSHIVQKLAGVAGHWIRHLNLSDPSAIAPATSAEKAGHWIQL